MDVECRIIGDFIRLAHDYKRLNLPFHATTLCQMLHELSNMAKGTWSGCPHMGHSAFLASRDGLSPT